MKHTLLFILVLFLPFLSHGQLIVNEVSNGPSGTKEYVELVVTGTPLCDSQTVDIRGWVIDDNNGWHALGSGVGIAPGHKRFPYIPQWASVRMGTIILIYNEADRNVLIPPDDETDANHDCVYILPGSSTYLEHNTSLPAGTAGMTTYAGATYTGTGAWSTLALNNTSDDIQTVSPSVPTAPYHAIGWGSDNLLNTVYYAGNLSAQLIWMNNSVSDDPFNASNFQKNSVTGFETPGAGNNAANTAWIDGMKTSCLPFTHTTITHNYSICSGASILIGGISRSTAGTYYDTLPASVGCDTIVSNILTVIPRVIGNRSITICSPATMFLGGSLRSTSGTYNDTIVAGGFGGCDTIYSTVLTVNPRSTATQNISICAPTGFFAGGSVRYSSGTFTDTFYASSYLGCDSILTTVLTVIPRSTYNIRASVCSPAGYFAGGAMHYSSGTFYDTLYAASYLHCDSIITTDLIVHPRSTFTRNITLCSPATFFAGGVTRSISGTYYDTLFGASSVHCDSIITTVLTINPRVSFSRNITICSPGSFFAGGTTRFTSGTYVDTLYGASYLHCDSVLTTVLSVTPRATASRNITLCSPSGYTLGGVVRYTTGTYTDTFYAASYLGCDSILTTNLTVNPRALFTRNITLCEPSSYLAGGSLRSSSGTFYDTLYGASYLACDSIITTNLTVNPRASATRNISICEPSTYVAGGSARSSSGTFYDTLFAASYLHCDSILRTNLTVYPRSTHTQSITLCAPAGFSAGGSMRYSSGAFYDTLAAASYLHCDSILTTVLTILPRASGTVNTSVCSPRGVFLAGAFRTLSGSYYDTLFSRASNGCDSILLTNLTVLPRAIVTQNRSICDGNILRVGRSRYTVAGTYHDTLVAINGCDSIITTNLSIIPVITQTQSARLCAGQNLLVNGHRYTRTGTYYDTLLSLAGCDSFVISNLVVDTMSAGDVNITFCQGGSSRFGGSTYTSAGLYYDTATDIRGCDSLLRIHVVVLTRPVTNLSPAVCAGQNYTVHGISYNVAGTYYDTLVAANGCDSILHITLTILPLASRTLNQSICSGDTLRIAGTIYTSSGSYYDTLTAANGCDSILHINLIVNTPVSAILSRNICEGSSIRIGAHTYNTAGTYFDTLTGSNGCDSMIRTDLSITPTLRASQNIHLCDGQTLHIGIHNYTASGNYWDTLRSSLGCDSILNTLLTVHTASTITSDTTFCDGELYNGVAYHSATTLRNTLRSSIGCDSIIYVVNIHIIPNLPLSVSHDTIICPGDAIQLHASGGSGSYIWSPSFGLSCDHCPDPITQPGSTVSYVVVSTNCQGLPITDNVTVDIAPSLSVSLNFMDTTIYFGQQVTIYAAPSHTADIHWLQLDSTLCSHCPELTFLPHVDGMYTAIATDQYNCKAQDSLFIHLLYGCGDSLIDIPNILTPNGDGANDLWYVKNPQNLYIYDVQVYDRWGELVFESYKANNPWDGSFQGAPVVPGVYTYAVEGRCAYGRLWQRKGNITVFK